MPRVGFVCPDGVNIPHRSCMAACRMESRCLTKSTLAAMANDYAWRGKPSTTQLLKPTRIAALEITCDYFQNPQDLAFMFIGSKAHKKLEGADTNVSILEQRFSDDDMSGVADCYEQENGTGVLTDYKTSGSYQVAKALGIVAQKVWPTGSRAPKIVIHHDPRKVDIEDWGLQLNRYRLFYQDAGFTVDRMQVQAFVRDGGTQNARDNGIELNIYLIPIPHMDDSLVRLYFREKREQLLAALGALKGGYTNLLKPCSSEETWGGRRCMKWCNVREFCKGVAK